MIGSVLSASRESQEMACNAGEPPRWSRDLRNGFTTPLCLFIGVLCLTLLAAAGPILATEQAGPAGAELSEQERQQELAKLMQIVAARQPRRSGPCGVYRERAKRGGCLQRSAPDAWPRCPGHTVFPDWVSERGRRRGTDRQTNRWSPALCCLRQDCRWAAERGALTTEAVAHHRVARHPVGVKVPKQCRPLSQLRYTAAHIGAPLWLPIYL